MSPSLPPCLDWSCPFVCFVAHPHLICLPSSPHPSLTHTHRTAVTRTPSPDTHTSPDAHTIPDTHISSDTHTSPDIHTSSDNPFSLSGANTSTDIYTSADTTHPRLLLCSIGLIDSPPPPPTRARPGCARYRCSRPRSPASCSLSTEFLLLAAAALMALGRSRSLILGMSSSCV